MHNKIKMMIPYVCTIILVALMTLSSELLNEKEIIFPEITALAVGYMVAKKRSWKVNSKRMLFLISTCAFVGVGVVRFMNAPILVEVVFAYSLAQVLFMYSGTTFAPFVSAVVLPVMMQTDSLVYPISAFVLTLLIIVFHEIFLKLGIREDEEYNPVMLNSMEDKLDAAIRILCVTVMASVAFFSGYRFIIAPPLLVAFTEFSRPRNKTRNKPVKTVCVITLCAMVGVVSRYVCAIKLSLPLTVAAVIATSIMLIILSKTEMYMPPVGAITMLSMIIKKEILFTYPIQIFVGSVVIMVMSRKLFMKRQDIGKYETEHELKAG